MNFSDTKIVPAGDRFDIDVANSSGLSLRVKGGVILTGVGLSYSNVPNKTLTLTASATNYVECSDAGVTSVSTAFTAGATELYVITTNATVITGIEDRRGATNDSTRRIQAMTANGAIRADAELVTLSKSGVLAATIAAPATGRRLVITQVDAGTDGHTVTLAAGTWNGTNAVATLNAAGESLDVIGISATRFLIITNVGAVAFSG